MSLTSLVKTKNPIRDRMRTWFPKPKLELDAKLLVPPRVKDRSLIGTAFDYILRFHLERQHPFAITQPWIAQRALSLTIAGVWQYLPEPEVAARLAGIFANAKLEHGRFLTTGQVTTDLLASTLSLAHCDVYYRTMRLGDRFWDRPNENEIEELCDLVKVIDKDRLSANEVCLLNPDFGQGSIMLGGADADLLLDDCLVEIKTTERLQIRVEDWRQLLGYAALNEHFPIGGRVPYPIRSIGIYFARYGYLAKWPIRHIVDPQKFSQFALMLAKYGTAMRQRQLEWESKRQKLIMRTCQKDLRYYENAYRKSRTADKSRSARGSYSDTHRERARRKSRPETIRWLIVAEAPPRASDRFFYFEEVTSHDWLFLALARALYSDVARMSVQDIRNSKRTLLRRFQSDGFFVVDSCSKPLNPKKPKRLQIRENIPALEQTLDRLRKDGCLTASTQILLISATVYQECFEALHTAGFNVVNSEAIPFPSHGHQNAVMDNLTEIVRPH